MFQNLLLRTSQKTITSSLRNSYKGIRCFANMKHVGLKEFGEADVIKIDESPIPQPKKDEVLIQVKSSALNRADTLQRRGRYPAPKGYSSIIGLEAAGFACKPDGSVDQSKRIMALLAGGGHAQYCIAHKDHLIEIPENLSFEEAGGLPETYITAFLLLELGQIKKNDKVLIYGGASGVGTSLIQLVRLYGGIPIVTVSTEEKSKFVTDLGAEKVINYKKTENLAESIKEASGGKGIDIIMDCVGPDYFAINSDVAALDSRWILYGLMSGAKTNANLVPILQKRIAFIGTTLRTRSDQYKAELIDRFTRQIMPNFKSGKLRVCVDSVVNVDWTDPKPIQEAHKRMEANKNSGKIILSFK